MEDKELLDDFKKHIEFEEGMEESMLPKYLNFAKRYVKTATGKQSEQLTLMVAALLFDFRVAEKDLASGLDSLTPFLLAEVFSEDEEINQ